MNKYIILDMDGTIADLYATQDWLENLRAENCTPYLLAPPIYDADALNIVLSMLQHVGYKIHVVTWTSKGGSVNYNNLVKLCKKAWLKQHQVPFDSFICVPYGTPKEDYIPTDAQEVVLIDDDKTVQSAFKQATMKATKKIIDAGKRQIITSMLELI